MPQHHTQQFQASTSLLNLEIVRKEEFQDMVELATIICDASIGMINLVDHQHQYIKFKIGIQVDTVRLEDSFCQYISEGVDLLMIPDITKDQRFYDHPFVAGPPYMRFYAGIPLISQSGTCIGSICVLGLIPKNLTESQKLRFKMLAKRVVEMLDIELSLVA